MLPQIIRKSEYLSDLDQSVIFDETVRSFPVFEQQIFRAKTSVNKVKNHFVFNEENGSFEADSKLKDCVNEVINVTATEMLIKIADVSIDGNSGTVTPREILFLKQSLSNYLMKHYSNLSLNEIHLAFELGRINKLPKCKPIFSMPNFIQWIDAYIEFSKPIISKITNEVHRLIDSKEALQIEANVNEYEVNLENKLKQKIIDLETEFDKNGDLNYDDIGNVMLKVFISNNIIIDLSSEEFKPIYIQSCVDRIEEVKSLNSKFLREDKKYRCVNIEVLTSGIKDKSNKQELEIIKNIFNKKALNYFLKKCFSNKKSDEYIRLFSYVHFQ